MRYGNFPLIGIKNAMRRTLEPGTFAIGVDGLSVAVGYDDEPGHLFLDGERAFRESIDTKGNEQVLVLPSLELSLSVGKVRPARDFLGEWPAGWIRVTQEDRVELAFISEGIGGQTHHATVNLETGDPSWDIDNLHRHVWISDWELLAIQNGTLHSLARHTTDELS